MYYENKTFENVNISSELIEDSEFVYCNFYNCTIDSVNIDNCEFQECIFKNCTLSGIESDQTRAYFCIFEDCNLLGINWSHFTDERRSFLPFQSFTNCVLRYNYFFQLPLIKTDFSSCQVTKCDFTECNLTSCDFEGTNLDGTSFFKSNLTKANFRNASGYSVDAKTCTLKNAVFSLPDAVSLLYSLEVKIV